MAHQRSDGLLRTLGTRARFELPARENNGAPAIADARDLLSALDDIAIEHHLLGSSDRDAIMFMALIKLAMEKVQAAEKAHGIEYRYVSPQLRPSLEAAA